MDVVEVAPASGPAPTLASEPPIWDRTEKLATWVFGAFVAVAALLLLFYFGTYHWFHGDEWDLLVDRDGGHLGDLLKSHNEHLTFLPILVYRGLWQLVGMRSYLPYQVPVVALHLTTAVLLRLIMRRCGVHPWLATAAAGVFVLFGPGEENIIWAFQITFTGSLAFGLAQLVLADHPGDVDRRDWLALGCGFLGFLCSGLTPLTAAVVGAVVLVRRGWRPAAFQVVPLAAVYLLWWVAIGPNIISDPYNDRSPAISDITHFVGKALSSTYESLAGGSPILAVVLAVLLAIGLVLAYAPLRGRARLEAAVMPVSLLAAGLAFAVTSAYGRWWFGDVGDSSRYQHLIAAFSLPALAVAANALAKTWRYGVPVATIAFVAMIPYGASQFETNDPWNGKYFSARRALIAAMGRSEFVDQVPSSVRPDTTWSTITTGWLHDAREDGKLPSLDDAAAADSPAMRLRFGVSPVVAPPLEGRCSPLRSPVDLTMNRGDEISVDVARRHGGDYGGLFAAQYVVQLLENGKPVARIGLHPAIGRRLRASFDDLHVRVVPARTSALVLCRSPGA